METVTDPVLRRLPVRHDLLAHFDREMRQHPPTDAWSRVEREDGVVRVVGDDCRIEFSDLDEDGADEAIRRECDLFSRSGTTLEWKVYGHDRPADLGRRLEAAGFVADPAETFRVLDLAREPAPPTGIAVTEVTDVPSLEEFVSVVEDAFDDAQPGRLEALARRLGDPELRMLLIRVEGRPACVGRVDLPTGRSFAALYGGCTHPSFRGHGLFRALVSARAALARQQGHGFLTVDARPTSAPILSRLGFQPLTSVTGWVLRP